MVLISFVLMVFPTLQEKEAETATHLILLELEQARQQNKVLQQVLRVAYNCMCPLTAAFENLLCKLTCGGN